MSKKKTTEMYAFEEVIADSAALMIANEYGCSDESLLANSVEYIVSWIRDGNVKQLMEAFKQGAEAARYIMEAYEHNQE